METQLVAAFCLHLVAFALLLLLLTRLIKAFVTPQMVVMVMVVVMVVPRPPQPL